MKNKVTIVTRGGEDLERVYLYDARLQSGAKVIEVKASAFPAVKDMGDVILRHLGRYGLVLPFIRPGYRVLDFPCGSGLALEVLGVLTRYGGFVYEGWEYDLPTILYCQKIYGEKYPWAHFAFGDLTTFTLDAESYDTICCIEGIEHIGEQFQKRAVAQFASGLARGGTLVISSPAASRGISGANEKNPYHLWELASDDFIRLLETAFGRGAVEMMLQENVLSTGERVRMNYAIGHKK